MKSKSIINLIIRGLLAIGFAGAAITKLIGVEMQVKNLESWGYPLWLRFPIGFGEILLAIGLFVPSLRKLTVNAIFLWGLAAIITHVQASPPQFGMLGGPIVFLLLNSALLFLSKSETNKQ